MITLGSICVVWWFSSTAHSAALVLRNSPGTVAIEPGLADVAYRTLNVLTAYPAALPRTWAVRVCDTKCDYRAARICEPDMAHRVASLAGTLVGPRVHGGQRKHEAKGMCLLCRRGRRSRAHLGHDASELPVRAEVDLHPRTDGVALGEPAVHVVELTLLVAPAAARVGVLASSRVNVEPRGLNLRSTTVE